MDAVNVPSLCLRSELEGPLAGSVLDLGGHGSEPHLGGRDYLNKREREGERSEMVIV